MTGGTENESSRKPRRWLWFVGLYAASLIAFTIIVHFLRWLIL